MAAGRCSSVLWTAVSLLVGLSTVSCTTFYFVHDSMVYSMAEEYCKSRQGGSLAVFSDKFDWDCIQRDQWFWTDDKKECKWYGSGTKRCRKITFWNNVLGLDSRPFICTTEEDMDHIHDYYDYSDISLSVCYTVPPTQETSTLQSTPKPGTPEPENSTLANSTIISKDGPPKDGNIDIGLVAGVASGVVLILLLTGCSVFIFLQRRKKYNRKENATMDTENSSTVERSETITSRIGSAVQKCKQKFQRKSPERNYETPVPYRQEREYDQLNSPMLPAEVVYADPSALSCGNIEQDELGYLVSQGGETNGYTYIVTTDGSAAGSLSDPPPAHRGIDCENPVYEDMCMKDVIVGTRGKQGVSNPATKNTSAVSRDPATKLRPHEYLNSPVIGRLLTDEQKQNKSNERAQEIAIVSDTYDDKLCKSPTSSTSHTDNSDAKLSSTNDNSESVSKNVKGNKIRNIILKLQGASDA